MPHSLRFVIKKRLFPIVVLSAILVGLITRQINYSIDYQAGEYMLGFEDVIGEYDAAVVLGAKVYANGALGTVVRDRADMAIKLYKAGRAKKVLVSADNSTSNYNETKAIYNYLRDSQIPKDDIFLDFAGFDTYDSMYRAKHNFLVKSILIPNLVNYCPRSIYLARALDMDAWCVTMPRRFKPTTLFGYYRETFAKVKAKINVLIGSKAYFATEDTYPISGTGNAGLYY